MWLCVRAYCCTLNVYTCVYVQYKYVRRTSVGSKSMTLVLFGTKQRISSICAIYSLMLSRHFQFSSIDLNHQHYHHLVLFFFIHLLLWHCKDVTAKINLPLWHNIFISYYVYWNIFIFFKLTSKRNWLVYKARNHRMNSLNYMKFDKFKKHSVKQEV